jgi:hypothetical protein
MSIFHKVKELLLQFAAGCVIVHLTSSSWFMVSACTKWSFTWYMSIEDMGWFTLLHVTGRVWLSSCRLLFFLSEWEIGMRSVTSLLSLFTFLYCWKQFGGTWCGHAPFNVFRLSFISLEYLPIFMPLEKLPTPYNFLRSPITWRTRELVRRERERSNILYCPEYFHGNWGFENMRLLLM